jgi:P pilus assembly chaperone PapD
MRSQDGALSATRRGSSLALAAFALAVGLLVPRTGAAQVSVDQAELFLDPSGTGRRVGSFNITNEGSDVAQVSIYLSDWDRQENGEHRFVPSGTLPNSCAPHMQIFPQSLRLPAGRRQAVRVELTGATDSITAACWSIAFVETSAQQKGTGRTVSYVTRLGVKIYVLPPGLTKEGEVEGIVAQPADSGRTRIAITFHDVGGMPLWVHGTMEYRRPDNSVAATDSVSEFPVLPGARRQVFVTVPRLKTGNYVALVLLDYAGPEIAAGQLPLQVP